MKRLFSVLLIMNFLYAGGHHAYEGKRPGIGIILGQVINKNAQSPIEYASVSLIHIESNEVKLGQLTTMDGRFMFDGIHACNYIVEIQFMGFESLQSNEINISNLKILHKTDSYYEFVIDIEVESLKVLQNLIIYQIMN